MFTPDKKILSNYAKVMIDFALGKGKGVKPGQVVYLQYDTEALPLALFKIISRHHRP
ncbi:MAG: Thermophilic metalloprotease (M29) superfamily [Candidatus Roizmanbacteria bacterium GW2011_GWA2_35_19]|uniref:Thermophilic metalloprotease (M29) superfamily n=1 Tax=Candidatus Roizmanbacteria bacterium GW2011_GWA2_35_19 TaxID=1618478 RepID=A0A0G0BUG7_9BACT|nr:MAG: Thermophilic metalloprotease (M29) superfamily [Candidatus Roizmanbacteria bacterium GW2011_GWA2_35_19]